MNEPSVNCGPPVAYLEGNIEADRQPSCWVWQLVQVSHSGVRRAGSDKFGYESEQHESSDTENLTKRP